MQSVNIKNLKALQNDNIFVTSEIVNFSDIVGMNTRKGYEQAIIVGDGNKKELVNIVSNSYVHLPNEDYFLQVESSLLEANVKFVKRSINRNNRSFAVDYILTDENEMTVNNGKDGLLPMLRFTNSYDGSGKTSGHFAIYRKVCSNGLHIVEHSEIGFSVKHSSKINTVVLPSIDGLIAKFLDNEYYTLNNAFVKMANTEITDLNEFVKSITETTNLFKFEASDKNPLPGANARLVMDIIVNEANQLGTTPNMWLGYNAFNAVIHTKLAKAFDKQHSLDKVIFDAVLEMAI